MIFAMIMMKCGWCNLKRDWRLQSCDALITMAVVVLWLVYLGSLWLGPACYQVCSCRCRITQAKWSRKTRRPGETTSLVYWTINRSSTVCFLFTRDSCTGSYCWERVLAMGILSVCFSVCLSVTTRYRFKARWDRDSGFSPYDSLESLVSHEVIWFRWVRRLPSNEGIK